MINRILFSLVLFYLFGCIPVDDLGEYWDKGIIDPQLEGSWKLDGVEYPSQNQYLTFSRNKDCYDLISNSSDHTSPTKSIPVPCKTLVIGKHKFLMLDVREYRRNQKKIIDANVEEIANKMKMAYNPEYEKMKKEEEEELKKAPRSGGLILYKVEGDIFYQYSLKEDILLNAVKKGLADGVITDQWFDGSSRQDAKLPVLNEKNLSFLQKIANNKNNWEDLQKYKKLSNLERDLEYSRTYHPQNPKNLMVNVYLPDLKYFCEGKADVLRRHLQASPEWKVIQWGPYQIECHKRILQNGSWIDKDYGREESKQIPKNVPLDILVEMGEISPNTTLSDIKDRYSFLFQFRFSEESGNWDPLTKKPLYYKEVDPLSGEIQMNLLRYEYGINSYLSIGQKGLWVEFYEISDMESRKRTRSALEWLKTFLHEIKNNEEYLKSNGYVKSLIPEGFVRKGKPEILVEKGCSEEEFNITVFANPGQQGFVYLLARDPDTNDSILIHSDREYIGWSDNPEILFYYYDNIRLDEKKNNNSILFEFWFHPCNGLPTEDWFKPIPLPGDIKLVDKKVILD